MTSNTIKQNLDHTLFSWSAQENLNPIDAVKTSGSYIYDRDGMKYLDFSSQLMNFNIGHNHPHVVESIKK